MPAPHLAYNGGPVLEQVLVVSIGWQIDPLASSLSKFYGDITNSPYFDWLSEYDTSTPAQSIGRGNAISSLLATSPATTVTDLQIQMQLQSLIASSAVPQPTSNTLYALHFPAATTVTGPGGSRQCQDFCQYHSVFTMNGSGQNVPYLVVPSLSGCSSCGSAATELQNTTSAASHALLGAVTDPQNPSAVAWIDATNGEIGDICNGQQATLSANGTTYTVQKQWSNVRGACVVTGQASVAPALSAWHVGALAALLLMAGPAAHRARRLTNRPT